MSTVDRITPAPAIAPLAPLLRPVGRSVPGSLHADSSSVPAASSLRVRLAAPHELSTQLHRTMAVLDSADAALERTQAILAGARTSVAGPDATVVDPLLASIDLETAQPRWAGAPILRDGGTLLAGGGAVDIRPLSASDLGAIVAFGRSHRLSDVRSGGTLDPTANRSDALRCIDAAASEVTGARAQLIAFRSAELAPLQRDAIASVRAATDTGPSAANEMAPVAAAIRASLATDSSTETLGTHDNARVLTLLS